MTQEPYASAKRVFWVVDNGSSHRGKNFVVGSADVEVHHRAGCRGGQGDGDQV
jgi:hypothetical protein